MLQIKYTNHVWTFKDAGSPPLLYLAFLEDEHWSTGFLFVTRYEVEPDEGISVKCFTDLRDPTTGVRYKLTPMGEDET